MKIFAYNLFFNMNEEELREKLRAEFGAFGQIESITIPKGTSGKPRGVAFVEMSSVAEGQAAIAALNGKTIKDHTITVEEA